jgi:hypothetical protein
MIQIKTNHSAPRWARPQRTFVSAMEGGARVFRTQAASILRLLILVLVALLFVLIGLVLLTGRVELGVPIIGSVLFISFSASHFGR